MTSYELKPQSVSCPYCGELIEVLVDCSIPQQDYIEDCQVCCRPINIDVAIDMDGDVSIALRSDNE